jgi:hypothetical protein
MEAPEPDPETPLREILAEDVPLFLAMTFRTVADRSDEGFETVEFVTVAEGLAVREGINLPRVVNDHPDIVAEYLDDEITFPERTVEEFDRIIEEAYEPAGESSEPAGSACDEGSEAPGDDTEDS